MRTHLIVTLRATFTSALIISPWLWGYRLRKVRQCGRFPVHYTVCSVGTRHTIVPSEIVTKLNIIVHTFGENRGISNPHLPEYRLPSPFDPDPQLADAASHKRLLGSLRSAPPFPPRPCGHWQQASSFPAK